MRTMSRFVRGGAVVVLAFGVMSALAVSAGAKHRPPRKPPSNSGGTVSCSLVTPALIQSTLNLTVTGPNPTKNGQVLECQYPTSNGGPVIVRFQTGMNTSTFQAAEQEFSQHGEPTSSVPGSSYPTYSSSIGAGSFVTNTLVVLKGQTELLVTALAPLSAVQSLAAQILPKI